MNLDERDEGCRRIRAEAAEVLCGAGRGFVTAEDGRTTSPGSPSSRDAGSDRAQLRSKGRELSLVVVMLALASAGLLAQAGGRTLSGCVISTDSQSAVEG